MQSIHDRRSRSRSKKRARLAAGFALALLTSVAGWGCNKPAATEPVPETPAAEASPLAPAVPEPMPAAAAVEQAAAPMPSEGPAPPAEPPAAEPAEIDAAAASNPEAEDAWAVGAEWNEKLTKEPADFGAYGMRVPEGFKEVARGSDSPTSKQPFVIVYQSAMKEGTTPAIIAATFHPPGQEFPERDAMLAAYFANVTMQWPDSQRGKTEDGTVGGLPASRVFYEATLPNDQVITGVVYIIDHGGQRIVLQGGANSTAPEYPVELIDAAMRTLAKKPQ